MRGLLYVLGLLMVLYPLAGARDARSDSATPQTITVFAAASTTDALGEVLALFTQTSRVEVRSSFAASSTLAKQIANGAPVDLYLSANTAWMDYLAERGVLAADTRVDLLANDLVLIAPAASPIQALDPRQPGALAAALAEGRPASGGQASGRLAIGDPDHVPAGLYAKAALEALGAWDALAPHIARANDVRAALVLVARSEVPLGIAYTTDAALLPEVRIVGRFPSESHPPIVYPAALVAGRDSAAARRLLAFLTGESARAVFERHGFSVVAPSRSQS